MKESDGFLRIKGELTEVDEFKFKNRLSDAEYEYLLLKNSIGENVIGLVQFPNGTAKSIQR